MRAPNQIHEAARALDGARPRHAGGAGPGAVLARVVARGRELGDGFRELRGKLVAYYLVRLRAQPAAVRGERDLAALVAETYRRDPKHTAFLLERLCYDFVKGLRRSGGSGRAADFPRHLLGGSEAARALPEESLILLHAGLGMALTEILLLPLPRGSPAPAFAAALDSFFAQVEANARPEFAPVAFEALGLMVRRFMPHVHAPVEACLRARDERLAAYYWRGAGRAIYFLPGLFHPFPGAVRRGLEICRREPLEPRHRLDALAGFCFASTMINLRYPELVARLLPYLGPGEIEALASGVAGALLTRHHTSPDQPEVREFLRPLAADPSGRGAGPGAGDEGGPAADLAGLWENAVRRPCLGALDRAYPLLRARGELACLARHCPLGSLPTSATPATPARQEAPEVPGLPGAPEMPEMRE
ncbi:MAG TPA: hypothetical protein VN999_07750 [Thermoanaerobaculia bacterium]|nr:hypothetical protein [Thermoanaerobaculia bacterium]